MKKLLILSSIGLTAGCANMPVGWGGTHQITMANEKSISIVYDPMMGGYAAANNAANAHCARYGLSAVPTVREPSGILTEQVYECR